MTDVACGKLRYRCLENANRLFATCGLTNLCVLRHRFRTVQIKSPCAEQALFTEKCVVGRDGDLPADDLVLIRLVEPLVSITAVMTTELAKLTKRVIDDVRTKSTSRQLVTDPCVGPITALAFRATIDRPDRFRKSRYADVHLGLTPRRCKSGETDV